MNNLKPKFQKPRDFPITTKRHELPSFEQGNLYLKAAPQPSAPPPTISLSAPTLSWDWPRRAGQLGINRMRGRVVTRGGAGGGASRGRSLGARRAGGTGGGPSGAPRSWTATGRSRSPSAVPAPARDQGGIHPSPPVVPPSRQRESPPGPAQATGHSRDKLHSTPRGGRQSQRGEGVPQSTEQRSDPSQGFGSRA